MPRRPAVAALVLAAGRGERLGQAVSKAFVSLAGRTLVERSIRALFASQRIDRLVPVIAAGDRGAWAALAPSLADVAGLASPVVGGAERQDSMRAGLAALPADVTLVAVHDAARPFVLPSDVRRVLEAAREIGAALLAVPVTDTIKRVRGGRVVDTPLRSECWAAQTPQAFRVALLREALAKALLDGVVATDDVQLVERLGLPVAVVEGDPGNVKITRGEDLTLAEARLARSGGDAG
jgi:2-C-methyl-D-erythritol 4-phosphate cytidylyltransferase